MLKRLTVVLAIVSLTGCGGVAPRNEGPVYHISEIRIHGNRVTPDYRIREQLAVFPGQRYSAARLLTSQRRLALVGLDAVILARPPERGGTYYDLDVWVRETPLHYLVFGRK